MYSLMESNIINERFILNGENLKYRFVFDKIAETIGKAKPSIKVTPILKALSWRVEKLRSWLTGSSPKVTRETAHSSSTDIVYINKKSLAALNIPYTSVTETLENMGVDYLQAH